ncbi:hemicentin-1 isoform X2 [Paramuricea clavata]|uniref:Hemicentin-1 isoform X2 n=1 Tax=Paramuricea clavata TaxID=317549 RepID=A0A6S7GYU8_PARCT|nr:hemicentin-1 isoform X2 [Paramuricea clavata]
MAIHLSLYLVLAVLAKIHDVDCIEVEGVNKLNDYTWFSEGQNFTVSCTASGVNISCTAFQWMFFKSFEQASQLTPKMLIQTEPNGSVISSTVTLLNSTEFSNDIWYIRCSLVNTTNSCSPKISRGNKETTLILPFHSEDMPRVKVGSHNVSVDYGQDINLTCTASVFKYLFDLQITVAWLKDGRALKRIKTSNSLHDFPFTLSLRKVSSAGRYLCWISVDNNHDSQKFEDNGTVFLTVNTKLLGSEKKIYYLKPGQAFQVLCEINGDPLSLEIKWQMKTAEGNYSDISDQDITITDEGRILNIARFKHDGASYICRVMRKHGDGIHQESKLIARTEPTLTGPKQKEIKVEPHDDVTLTCDIDVLPLNITWTVHGTMIQADNSRYKISTKDRRLLLIKAVDFQDSRTFICSAKNGLNMKGVQQEIVVHVKDSMSALWPAIGIIIVAVLVAIIIGVSCYINRKRRQEMERREARELKDTNVTPSGNYGDQEDSMVGFDNEPRRLLKA